MALCEPSVQPPVLGRLSSGAGKLSLGKQASPDVTHIYGGGGEDMKLYIIQRLWYPRHPELNTSSTTVGTKSSSW